MSVMKSRVASVPAEDPKVRRGFPGATAGRRARIKAAIAADRETLRRLAK